MKENGVKGKIYKIYLQNSSFFFTFCFGVFFNLTKKIAWVFMNLILNNFYFAKLILVKIKCGMKWLVFKKKLTYLNPYSIVFRQVWSSNFQLLDFDAYIFKIFKENVDELKECRHGIGILIEVLILVFTFFKHPVLK